MAKGQGRKAAREFANPLTEAVSARDRDTLEMVRDAVRNKRVALAFQPVVQSAQPDLPAFHEGFIRVIDKTGRIIPARDFFGVVEDQELGRKLDTLALEMGLAELAAEPGLRLAINMSARSVAYPQWREVLERGLSNDATAAERLILEITEKTAIGMPDLVQVFMKDLQFKGITFALDDFGAGYTSFRYLKDFYFDILKIDGEFIRGIASNPDNQVVVQAMLSLARHFDMFTVAESVENWEDADMLAQCGVDCMQGYCFGAPTVNPLWRRDAERKAG